MAGQEDEAADITEFTSLLRARIVGAGKPTGLDKSEEEQLWHAVYGSVPLEGNSEEEVLRNLGAYLHRKQAASALVAAKLAVRVAALEGKPLLQVVDDLEQEILIRLQPE